MDDRVNPHRMTTASAVLGLAKAGYGVDDIRVITGLKWGCIVRSLNQNRDRMTPLMRLVGRRLAAEARS